jgi:predicted dehydrogenase
MAGCLIPSLGGGVALDVGCYVMSAARLLAGEASSGATAAPVSLTGTAVWQDSVDVDVRAELVFANNLQVYGTSGTMVVKRPFLLPRGADPTAISTRPRRVG